MGLGGGNGGPKKKKKAAPKTGKASNSRDAVGNNKPGVNSAGKSTSGKGGGDYVRINTASGSQSRIKRQPKSAGGATRPTVARAHVRKAR